MIGWGVLTARLSASMFQPFKFLKELRNIEKRVELKIQMKSVKKYRPYFTAPELREMCRLCEEHIPASNLARNLRRLIHEIDNDYIKPVYKTTPRETVMEKLGLVSSEDQIPIPSTTKPDHLTPWQREQQTRFEADLMNPQEQDDWINYCMENGI